MSSDIRVGVNTSQAIAQLDAVDEFSKSTALKVVGITRHLYDTILIGAAFIGATIDQSYQLMAQGVFAAAETVIAIRGAIAAGTFGASTILTGGLGVVSSIALFTQGYKLLTEKDKMKGDIDSMIMLGRMQQLGLMANIWRAR